MNAKRRSVLAILLFAPLAAILLATFACLPAPVGDPDKSKVDETISGIYSRQMPADPTDKTSEIAILRPWDGKTYLLQYLTGGIKDGTEQRQIQHFKAWLTTISDKTFITCEPMDNLSYALGDDGSKPFWVVLRLDKTDKGLEVRMVNPDSEFMKGLAKREDIEAAIKAHASDAGLYGDALNFKKQGKDDQALIDAMLSKFDTSHTTK
jgi:hypothetical protein